jgi:hypothetical protein
MIKKTHQIKTKDQFQISPLDGAQYEKISSDNNQQNNKMKNRYQENTTHLNPRNRPQHKTTRETSQNH